MHIYSNEEYIQKQYNDLQKKLEKSINIHQTQKSKIIKNYIYYNTPIKIN